PADIHGRARRIAGLEVLHPAGEAVEESEGHAWGPLGRPSILPGGRGDSHDSCGAQGQRLHSAVVNPSFLPAKRWLPLILATAFAAAPAWAQHTVIQAENVRYEYAQVLRAEPVYQTLRATSMVERCEQSSMVQPEEGEERRGLSRVVGAVRDVLTPGRGGSDAEGTPAQAEGDCRMVPVEREFRRPIAYDVDYVVRGVKYRSRLPRDPGNRLRVKVAVTPVVPEGNVD